MSPWAARRADSSCSSTSDFVLLDFKRKARYFSEHDVLQSITVKALIFSLTSRSVIFNQGYGNDLLGFKCLHRF